MSRRGLSGAVALLLIGAGLVGAGMARAERGPIELVSKSATEQADSAQQPAISADGRYVAFQGTIGGRSGLFRKDLETGALVPVVTVAAYPRPIPGEAGANPSISADGRFVSFTTPAPLDPADDGAGSGDRDVYVADMSSSPPTYELASARDGCDPAISSTPCGLTYAGDRGSLAAGRVALSADGSEVAFVVRAESDLTDEPGQVETPGEQVVVRNLATARTTLMSVERDPLTGAMTTEPVEGGAVATEFPTSADLGAALSADGSTVAWYGTDLPGQVPMLTDELAAIENGSAITAHYSEPLWRRVPSVAEPGPPTRRIVGGGDPLASGCPAGGTLADSACDGPFPKLIETTFPCAEAPGWLKTSFPQEDIPLLSADGGTVALIGEPVGVANVFIADMAPGLSRAQAVRSLTREVPIEDPCRAQDEALLPGAGPIKSVAISPDGRRIAFTTARRQFPLSPPHLVTQPPSKVGLAELYLVDLDGQTTERLTPADRSEASTFTNRQISVEGATALSFSGDGRTLAFASGASNLVGGDGNEASDVFVVTDSTPAAAPGATKISGAPVGPRVKRRWRLTASAVSMPNGRIKVRAVVPAAGRLRVKARASVGEDLAPRQVAASARRTRREGLLRVMLSLKRGYLPLAHGHGLPATLTLAFDGRGGKPLHVTLGARFRLAPSKQKSGGRPR